MINEALIAQIVEKVLNELNHSNVVSNKSLIISDDINLKQNEVSYLHYNKDEKYTNFTIDYLTLEECARIIHNIRHKEKVNFILDHYKNTQITILDIESTNIDLMNTYKEILCSLGFNFNDKIIEKKSIKIEKKLLNERDLMAKKLKENQVLHLAKGTIITPLAKDYLRKYKIQTVEED